MKRLDTNPPDFDHAGKRHPDIRMLQQEGRDPILFLRAETKGVYSFGMSIDEIRALRDCLSAALDEDAPQVAAAPAMPQGALEIGEDGWPKLTQRASAGVGRFGRGVSARLLVEACYRKAEYEVEDAAKTDEQRREDERHRRALWDRIHGPLAAAPEVAAAPADERDAFEAAYMIGAYSKGDNRNIFRRRDEHWDLPGDYILSEVESCWRGWRLRAAAAPEVAAPDLPNDMGYSSIDKSGPVGMALQFLQAALDCRLFAWDADQHECAARALKDAREWLQRLGEVPAAPQVAAADNGPMFTTDHPALNDLLTETYHLGQGAKGHDVGVMWADALEAVLALLAPQVAAAPGDEGSNSEELEPGSKLWDLIHAWGNAAPGFRLNECDAISYHIKSMMRPRARAAAAAPEVAPQVAAAPAVQTMPIGRAPQHERDNFSAAYEGYCGRTLTHREIAWRMWWTRAMLAAAPEVAPQDNMPMVDMVPPATSRDRWMFRQGWLAALDPRSHAAAPEVASPMQPVVLVEGVPRFRENTAVRSLLDHATALGFGLNELACEKHSDEDRMQLAQLIGYSVSGYGELSYVSDASYDEADRAAQAAGGAS